MAGFNKSGPMTEQALETRRKVLLAAMAAFAKGGYNGTSIRDIVNGSDVTLNMLVYHFGTKENLAAEVVRELKKVITPPDRYETGTITTERDLKFVKQD